MTKIPASFMPQSSRGRVSSRNGGSKSLNNGSKDSRSAFNEGFVTTERYVDSKGQVYIEMMS